MGCRCQGSQGHWPTHSPVIPGGLIPVALGMQVAIRIFPGRREWKDRLVDFSDGCLPWRSKSGADNLLDVCKIVTDQPFRPGVPVVVVGPNHRPHPS